MSAPRKSRSKRLPISGRLGAPREWSPTADDWRRFEETYDLKRVERFDDKLRNAIHAAVTKYFYWEPYEPNANFADDFIEGLDKAAKIARQLTDALTALGPDIALTASHWDRYFPRQAAEETADNVPDEDDAAFLKRIFDEKPRKRRRDIKETVHAIRNVGAEQEAKNAKRGIWAGQIQPPWEWRKDRRSGL